MSRLPRTAKLTDADRSADLSVAIQGHVSKKITQRFTHIATNYFSEDSLKLQIMEQLKRDQFGNLYVCHATTLFDGDVYTTVAWLGTEKWIGTEKKLVLVREWKKFGEFNESLTRALRGLAVVSFGRSNLAIMKALHAGKQIAVVSDRFNPPTPTVTA